MVRVLLIADLHGQFGKLDRFLEQDPDMVFIAGDITDFGPPDEMKKLLSRIDVPCFAVPGNCDPRECLDALEDSNAICLHCSGITIDTITLAGLGGSNPTPFNTPFEMSEEEIDEHMKKLVGRMEQNVHNVLITHAPAYDTVDCVGDQHVGSRSLVRYTEKFDLVCSAHIHEDRRVLEKNGTIFVNPGSASEGHFAIIEFGEEPGEIRVTLETV